MSNSDRPSKQSRTGHSSYHDTVPSLNRHDVIHVSEGTIRNIGGVFRATRRFESPQRVAGTWEQVTSWEPPDDEEYALNPDGDFYNTVVDQEVVAEDGTKDTVKRQQSKVSFGKRPTVKHIWKRFFAGPGAVTSAMLHSVQTALYEE
ncbi:hypothetical protein JR316_0001629 [Psilocybe cubensis]|uniref:Uncharacterized protein n=2 Tax=Psilocybe cubensis TaxID=181762 RepID=A0ACB8HC03_PSICU|nr:hypothetical protein JR316_0001629 [Psilocybe cubensis]KAH9484729.1 hypothetical protein JR316_0001629 [Psilocybe cubensis]